MRCVFLLVFCIRFVLHTINPFRFANKKYWFDDTSLESVLQGIPLGPVTV